MRILFQELFSFKRKGPWSDARVRRAMALIIDYEGAITAGAGGSELKFIPAAGILNPELQEALPHKEIVKLMGGIDQALEKRITNAKELLKEAGFPDGFSAEIIVRGEEQNYVKPAVFVVDPWKRCRLVSMVEGESDVKKRIAAAQKAQRLFYEELPYICLYATTYVTAWRPDSKEARKAEGRTDDYTKDAQTVFAGRRGCR